MRALLDVNVLIALLDPDHIFNTQVKTWVHQTPGGWATCPITENGLVRIVCGPSYPNPVSAPDAISLLERIHPRPRVGSGSGNRHLPTRSSSKTWWRTSHTGPPHYANSRPRRHPVRAHPHRHVCTVVGHIFKSHPQITSSNELGNSATQEPRKQ